MVVSQTRLPLPFVFDHALPAHEQTAVGVSVIIVPPIITHTQPNGVNARQLGSIHTCTLTSLPWLLPQRITVQKAVCPDNAVSKGKRTSRQLHYRELVRMT